MEKMLISFSDPQAQWLRERADELGISVSELVRRVLDREREALEYERRALAMIAIDYEDTKREAAQAAARHDAEATECLERRLAALREAVNVRRESVRTHGR